MVEFASYKAQTPVIQVPSLMGLDSQQEETMWKKAGDTLGNINKIALEEYAYKAKEQAKEKAVLDVEAGLDLKDVPKANTVYGKQYEESATNAYLAQLSIDSADNLERMRENYKSQPQKLKQMQEQYIKGTVDNLPAPIRPEVNKSLTIKAMGDYSSALREFNAKQEKINQEVSMLNLYKLKKKITDIPEPRNEIEAAAQAQYNAEFEASLEHGIKTGAISAKEYEVLVDEVKTGKINNYIYSGFIKASPEERIDFEDAILKGSTGNPLIDTASEDTRVDYLMVTQNKFRQIQSGRKAAEREEIERKKQEQIGQMVELQNTLSNNWVTMATEEREDLLNEMSSLASSTTELNHINSLRKAYVENVQTPTTLKRELLEDWTNGELSLESLRGYLDTNILSVDDYNDFFKKYNSKEGAITRSVQYKELMSQIKVDYKIAETRLSLLTDPEQIRNAQILEYARGMVLNKVLTEEIKTPEDITTQREAILKSLRGMKEPVQILNINGNEITDPVQIETIVKAKNASPKVAQAIKGLEDQVKYWKETKQFSPKKVNDFMKAAKDRLSLTKEEEDALGDFYLTYQGGLK